MKENDTMITAENVTLATENVALREALAEYAKEENWYPRSHALPEKNWWLPNGNGYDLARTALGTGEDKIMTATTKHG